MAGAAGVPCYLARRGGESTFLEHEFACLDHLRPFDVKADGLEEPIVENGRVQEPGGDIRVLDLNP